MRWQQVLRKSAFVREKTLNVYPDGIDRHYWNHARNHVIAHLIDAYCPNSRTIFDVGCGRGVVTGFLRDEGKNVWGCDASSGPPLNQRVAPFIAYKRTSFEVGKEFASKVDTLLFLDVLEHLENPKPFLLKHREFYPNLTSVIATFPACQKLWTNFDEHVGHVKRYDVEGAKKLFSETRPDNMVAGYFFHSLYLAVLLLKKFDCSRKTAISSPKRFSRIFHRLAASAFWGEYRLLPAHFPGSSVYLVATYGQKQCNHK